MPHSILHSGRRRNCDKILSGALTMRTQAAGETGYEHAATTGTEELLAFAQTSNDSSDDPPRPVRIESIHFHDEFAETGTGGNLLFEDSNDASNVSCVKQRFNVETEHSCTAHFVIEVALLGPSGELLP